jgi:hypothetical protein
MRKAAKRKRLNCSTQRSREKKTGEAPLEAMLIGIDEIGKLLID